MLTTVEKIQIIDKYSLSNRFFNMFYLESNSVMGATAKKRRELAAEMILKRKGRDLTKTFPHSLSLSSVLFYVVYGTWYCFYLT